MNDTKIRFRLGPRVQDALMIDEIDIGVTRVPGYKTLFEATPHDASKLVVELAYFGGPHLDNDPAEKRAMKRASRKIAAILNGDAS